MVVRDSKDGAAIVSTQEDHAEVSAQLAARWGNQRFMKPRPYPSMVFAATFHDSGYREWEGTPPINLEKGRPYGHREKPPSFEAVELAAFAHNIDWVRSHDPYAGLLVSMHRTGLWKNRYGVFKIPEGRLRERSAETKSVMKELESRQEKEKTSLGKANPRFEEALWVNYRLLQIYDLLSLYFCCDGHTEYGLKESMIAPVPVTYDTQEETELHILPVDSHSVKIQPYPFDVSPVIVSVRIRTIPAGTPTSQEAGREAFYKAPRSLLNFEITE
ncbi:MAG: DUF3891 family protein [Candidatus Binatia bacterium]